MTKFVNYFLTSKKSRLTQGHLNADDLKQKILGHDGSTAFCCYFDLDQSRLKLEWDTGKVDRDGKKIYEYKLPGEEPSGDYKCNGLTFTQYEGIARPSLNCVGFDFDSEDIEDSLEDVKNFVDWIAEDDVLVFFSGGKGFHVLVPFDYFGLEVSEHLPNQLKDMAKFLAKTFKTLDTSIYNYNRKFRVPFSKHDKTGLYKNLVNLTDDLTVEEIEKQCSAQVKTDFFDIVKPKNRQPLEIFQTVLEESKRKSYEVEKDRAGTIDKPSPFEKYDDKLCIKKMLEQRCDDIGRNNACMRIVNDYYRTGKTQAKCERDVSSWATENGLPLSEVSMIITNVYSGKANYNFGCQDEHKAAYCSAKCSIWKKLDPDKRPQTVDMPNSAIESGGKKNPKEFEVVEKVLRDVFRCDFDEKYRAFTGGIICKQGKKDLFLYHSGYWKHLEDEDIDKIKIKFNALYENNLTTRRIDAIFKMFMMYVPSKPKEIDMFVPRANVANFRNGTLHLKTDRQGQYSLEFKEHDKEDYITFIVDHDYEPESEAVNQKFESWLMEYLSGDKEQFNLVQEMFGASLVPNFPQFFALVGPSGTGKTTCIKVLKKLHGDDERNISKVPPHKFSGFHMQSMAGKLVNIVTDINTNAVIDDDVVKQVEDRDSVRIERKGEQDIYAPLPALHIFGANSMPKTFEGYSGAMNRRWSIIKFEKVHTGPRNRNIADLLYSSNPKGVLNFAVKGLARLAIENQGFFGRSTASDNAVIDWTKKDDIIQAFADEFVYEGFDMGGEIVKFEYGEDAKIERPKLWKYFKKWQEDGLAKNKQLGKTEFYNMITQKGFEVRKVNGVFCFVGIGELEPGADASTEI